MSTAPGWHSDPGAPGTQRYWDGEQWLGESLPAGAVPPAGPILVIKAPPQATPPPPVPQLLPPGFPEPPPRPHGFRLATPGARFVARLVDMVVLFGVNLVAAGYPAYLFFQGFFSWLKVVNGMPPDRVASDAPPADFMGYVLTILLIVVVTWGAYEIPALAGTGQTLGKRLTGIRVVRLDSAEPLGFWLALRRWSNMAIPTLLWYCCGVGLLFQILDSLACLVDRPYQQCVHDKAVRTVVVDVREGVPGDPTDPR